MKTAPGPQILLCIFEKVFPSIRAPGTKALNGAFNLAKIALPCLTLAHYTIALLLGCV
jgi:hypothetical protein